jgi:phage shock protein A
MTTHSSCLKKFSAIRRSPVEVSTLEPYASHWLLLGAIVPESDLSPTRLSQPSVGVPRPTASVHHNIEEEEVMGLFDRVSRVVRANMNDMVSKAEDPEKILEQAIIDMQEDLVQLRQAVASAIASQKRTQQQYNQAQTEANNWQQRAQLALQKGDENLAREALSRKKTYADTSNSLKAQLDQQNGSVDTLKRNLIALEGKISEAKTKKDMLKARASAAKANEQLQNTVGRMGTGSAMSAFERMEDKVLQMEARSQAAAELAGSSLEQQFAMLESGSGVDEELAAMKAQLLGGAPQAQAQLPGTATSEPAPAAPKDAAVDAELEKLKQQLDNLS